MQFGKGEAVRAEKIRMRLNRMDEELIIYRDFEEGELFEDMVTLVDGICSVHASEGTGSGTATELTYRLLHRFIELAGKYGFYGNIWACYLTNLLVNHENAYSCACEVRGEIEGTINSFVLHDMAIFRTLYRISPEYYAKKVGVPELALLENYEIGKRPGKIYNTRIRDAICKLSEKLFEAAQIDEEDLSIRKMKDELTDFYEEVGVGKFGLHKSFRIRHTENGAVIEPITNIAHVYFSDLIGYESAKKKLRDNTDAFVAGRNANNCLLFGDAGTGKSSSVKALANEYFDKGLRIIEIYRHQFCDLQSVIAQIKNRNYKFILYMDDLSFEDFETEYKYLKAVIEGGLEKKPANVLIYATSNRRHLIRENSTDREEIRTDMHTGDTVQEKLSLSYRFGVTIYFGRPDKKQFREIVLGLAQKNHINMPEEELLLEANKWELSHGGISGRTAQQFIDYLAGGVYGD